MIRFSLLLSFLFVGLCESKTIPIDFVGNKKLGEIQIAMDSTDTVAINGAKLFSIYHAWSVLAVCGAGGEAGIVFQKDLEWSGYIEISDTVWFNTSSFPTKSKPFDAVPMNTSQVIIGNSYANPEKNNGFPIVYIRPGSCNPNMDFSLAEGYRRIFYIRNREIFAKIQIARITVAEYSITQMYHHRSVVGITLRYAISKDKDDLGGVPVNVREKANRKSPAARRGKLPAFPNDALGRSFSGK